MTRCYFPIRSELAVMLGVALALGAGQADGTGDDGVFPGQAFLGETDLAEWMEIQRNGFRRITPGNMPLVQPIGTWPAAWEEFSPAWGGAATERDLRTWVVPVVAERDGETTVLRDGDGVELWRGTTDFSKAESSNVTLSGALVDEMDWALWEAARDEIDRRFGTVRMQESGGLCGYTNGPCTNELRFTDIRLGTNGDVCLDLAWETNGDVQVFCRALHSTSWVETVVWTNDENVVVTNDVTHWIQVDGRRSTALRTHGNCWAWRQSRAVPESSPTRASQQISAGYVSMWQYPSRIRMATA